MSSASCEKCFHIQLKDFCGMLDRGHGSRRITAEWINWCTGLKVFGANQTTSALHSSWSSQFSITKPQPSVLPRCGVKVLLVSLIVSQLISSFVVLKNPVGAAATVCEYKPETKTKGKNTRCGSTVWSAEVLQMLLFEAVATWLHKQKEIVLIPLNVTRANHHPRFLFCFNYYYYCWYFYDYSNRTLPLQMFSIFTLPGGFVKIKIKNDATALEKQPIWCATLQTSKHAFPIQLFLAKSAACQHVTWLGPLWLTREEGPRFQWHKRPVTLHTWGKVTVGGLLQRRLAAR